MFHLLAAFLMRSDLTWVGGCRMWHCCGPTPGQQKQDGFSDGWQSQDDKTGDCVALLVAVQSFLILQCLLKALSWTGLVLDFLCGFTSIDRRAKEWDSLGCQDNPVKCRGFEARCHISLHVYNQTAIYWYTKHLYTYIYLIIHTDCSIPCF